MDGISDATENSICTMYPTIPTCTGTVPQTGINPNTDTDGDGIPDIIEYTSIPPTDPTNPNDPFTNGNDDDDDNDGIPNGLEQHICAEYPTADNCPATNGTEITPTQDTDGDGIPDYIEVKIGSNPTDPNDPVNP